MLHTSFIWLIEQQFLLSSLLCVFIILERFCLKFLSPTFLYKLVLVLPIALLINNLPESVKPLQTNLINFVLVSPNTTFIKNTSLGFGLIYAYIATTSILLIHVIVINRRFVSRLNLNPVVLTKRLGQHLTVRVFESPTICSPMVIGLIQSKLVLPTDFEKHLSAEAIPLVLEHESIHIQRKDNLVNTLLLLQTVLLWFNPIAWLALGSVRRVQELSCDEKVLTNKTVEQHILYGKALISCAEKSSKALLSYSHYGNKKDVLQRLNQIHRNSKNSATAKCALLIVAACLLSTLAIAKPPAYRDFGGSEITLIYRVDAVYPQYAVTNGLDGSVVLKYDITPNGETSNISMVRATPKEVFNNAAMKSLEQWLYKSSVNGYQDVFVQLDFEIAPE